MDGGAVGGHAWACVRSPLRLTKADVGFHIGCVCTSPSNAASKVVGFFPKEVVGIDTSMVTPGIVLIPHAHHKYCDRRVRVRALLPCCVAGGGWVGAWVGGWWFARYLRAQSKFQQLVGLH